MKIKIKNPPCITVKVKQAADYTCTILDNRQCVKLILTTSQRQNEKKSLRETQTLRAKKFRPAADPLPGGARPLKLNQLEMVTSFT